MHLYVARTEEKDIFYDKSQENHDNIPNYLVKLLLGDFNSQVSLDGDRQGYTLIGVGEPNWSKIVAADKTKHFNTNFIKGN